MNVFKKLSSWYFSKNVLPYWVVLVADTVIVFASCCFTFWITNNTDIAFESRAALLYSAAAGSSGTSMSGPCPPSPIWI